MSTHNVYFHGRNNQNIFLIPSLICSYVCRYSAKTKHTTGLCPQKSCYCLLLFVYEQRGSDSQMGFLTVKWIFSQWARLDLHTNKAVNLSTAYDSMFLHTNIQIALQTGTASYVSLRKTKSCWVSTLPNSLYPTRRDTKENLTLTQYTQVWVRHFFFHHKILFSLTTKYYFP